MKKILLAALFAVLSFTQAEAQSGGTSTSAFVTFRYNLNSTTELFCALSETSPIPVSIRVATSGSSTTVTGVGAFANIAVGAQINGTDSVAGGGEQWTAVVMARASADSITVDTALNLTSSTLLYRALTCGTTSSSGAFDVSRSGRSTVQIDIAQLVLATPGTSTIDSRILCRVDPSAAWLQVYPVLTPPTVTASYVSLAVVGGWAKEINGTYSQCRVGLKIDAADDASGDAGSNAEWVSISVRKALNQQ